MSLFPAPDEILQKLDSIRCLFLWDGNNGSHKLHLAKWDKGAWDFGKKWSKLNMDMIAIGLPTLVDNLMVVDCGKKSGNCGLTSLLKQLYI
ncbi:hypothetical protein H5410_003389 [Solanum commersonii]|uniref:Uncharacterized protein n=1 Tax=Solanum commersonii TaxID=4109 RepID=A0A9J6B4V9_SOLCO|nr:hypothetical protein H5410_003389 [Solanum commersonii]